MISQTKLDFYIENGLNLLLVGRHGVGKTACVVEAFNRHKLNWLYFSCATMDPWVDFVGIPKEVTDDNGTTYLELVRPKVLAEDMVQAIFLDEFNRGSDKVRNAVLELIQFKSINGKKFNNLKTIIAAINPEDDIYEYDVAKLDGAQKDRFHGCIEVPYEIDKNYFTSKYGDYQSDAIHDWWSNLGEAVKNHVSPRRADYALQIYNLGGDLRDVLPMSANVPHLLVTLQNGSIENRLKLVMESSNAQAASKMMKNDTEYTEAIKYIVDSADMCKFFLPFVNEEKYAALVIENMDKEERLKNVIEASELCDGHKKTIENLYYKPEYQYNIVKSRPVRQFDGFGIKAVCMEIKKDMQTDAFPETVNEYNKNHTASLAERKTQYAYITDNICLSGANKNGNAVVTALFCFKAIKLAGSAEKANEEFPNVFEVLNACLKHLKYDVRTEIICRMQAEMCVTLGVEELVWIPS